MTIHVEQEMEYERNDWWNWSVWVEGDAAELDCISSVVYTLHSTFANPVRTITDRRTKFRLQSAGWGGFTIYAQVFDKEGSSRKLEHSLKLYYPGNNTPTDN